MVKKKKLMFIFLNYLVKKNSQFKEMISSQNKTVSTMLPISGEYKIETKKND